MLSIKLKNRISKTVRNIRKAATGKKILTFFISSLLVLCLALGILVLYYSKDIIAYSIGKKSDNPENNLMKMAQDAYNKGYLENSAIQFQTYLTTNPSKINKIIVYKKLFEINVLRRNYDDAFLALKEIELLDSRDSSIYINRIKLLLKIDQLKGAKFEIDRMYNRFKKSPEFLELFSVYYIKTNEYTNAINEIFKIPFRKRGYEINIKVVHCYIKLNQISRAISYLHKMEPVVRTYEDKFQKGEFLLVRSIANMLKGDYDLIHNDLRPGILEGELRNISYRLMIFTYIMQDSMNDLNNYLTNPEVTAVFDTKLFSLLGNYYFYKKQYETAALYYEKIKDGRNYTQDELLALVDIYYWNVDYASAEKIIKELNEQFGFKNPSYFKNISRLRLLQDDFPQAYSYLKQGILEYPDDDDFYFRLALINYNEGLLENATQYVKDGIRSSKLLRSESSKKFDILRLMLSGDKSRSLTELDLLEMRNQNDADIQSYYRIIEFYLQHNRLFDAKREMDTVRNLPLTKEQQRVFNVYLLIYSINFGEDQIYTTVRELILNDKYAEPLYKSVCYFLDGDYDKTLSEILYIENNQSVSKTEKLSILYYIKSLAYYFKADYSSTNISLMQLLEIDPFNRKALYLKGLLHNKVE